VRQLLRAPDCLRGLGELPLRAACRRQCAKAARTRTFDRVSFEFHERSFGVTECHLRGDGLKEASFVAGVACSRCLSIVDYLKRSGHAQCCECVAEQRQRRQIVGVAREAFEAWNLHESCTSCRTQFVSQHSTVRGLFN
jgi:hypothetical protein